MWCAEFVCVWQQSITYTFVQKNTYFAYVQTWEGGSRRLYDADGPNARPVSLTRLLLVRPIMTSARLRCRLHLDHTATSKY